ncbi:uncharacterized protein LOC131029071 isoform X2 [Cryptomeria japonica]|uniref:uncharacterized protein LOC131029071 isoform X2 n=1 Tax=Cryptomeria japonica TaxID=3369 RepID=UPI0027DA0150|nr:uncharacterized protein LOC131029071 isoform X2 [Cryptomeria japonica]
MGTRLVAKPFIHTPCHHHTLLVLCGRKANKKSKRKEKDTEAPRITSNVKQNLQVLKQQKVSDWPNSQIPKPTPRYRKKKENQKELPTEDDVYEDPPKLNDKKKNFKGKPVLLVDGYNVCGYWPKLKKHFYEGRLELVRQQLVDELICFSAVRGVKVVVVYDAMKSGRRTHKEAYQNIDIVYSAKSSADTWIEREVEALLADGCPRVWVATSDNLEKRTALFLGAYVWSCQSLIEEIEDAQIEYEERLLELRADSMKRGMLVDSLKPQAFSALKELKRKLEEYERSQTRSK